MSVFYSHSYECRSIHFTMDLYVFPPRTQTRLLFDACVVFLSTEVASVCLFFSHINAHGTFGRALLVEDCALRQRSPTGVPQTTGGP